ncbi:hypothetical protein [Oceanobacillus kimchii]|nr:hypothetical protein [Oceanobacillus kimchii]
MSLTRNQKLAHFLILPIGLFLFSHLLFWILNRGETPDIFQPHWFNNDNSPKERQFIRQIIFWSLLIMICV